MVDDAFVRLLAARVRELEATQAGLEANQAEMAGRLAEATTVSAIIARAGGDTGPMPVVPRQRGASHRRDRHGLHIVKGYAAAALVWALKGTFGAVKAHKASAAMGLGLAALLMAMMAPTRLNDHALVVNQPSVASGSANVTPVAHRHRDRRQHRAVMSRRP